MTKLLLLIASDVALVVLRHATRPVRGPAPMKRLQVEENWRFTELCGRRREA
jgi:hypothetical protein